MAGRLKKYSDRDIAAMLVSESDSDIYEVPITKTKADETTDSSDTENIFDGIKYSLPKKSELKKDSIALKIKLRRSTEQSMYKIDTDSDCERTVRKSRAKTTRKAKSIISSEIETEVPYSDSNNYTEKTELQKEISHTPDTGEKSQRRGRTRKPPLKLAHYHCDTLPVGKNGTDSPESVKSPSLRTRRNINYNEDVLFLSSVTSNKSLRERVLTNKKRADYNSDSSAGTLSTGSKDTNSTTSRKRNRKLSAQNDENGGGMDSEASTTEVPKTRSSRSSSVVNKSNLVTETNVKTPKKQNSLKAVSEDVTNGTSNRQRRKTAENIATENALDINNKNVLKNVESVVDTPKRRIRNASTNLDVSTTHTAAENIAKENALNINNKNVLKNVESLVETPKRRTRNASTNSNVSTTHIAETVKENNEFHVNKIPSVIESLAETPKHTKSRSTKRNASTAQKKPNTPKSIRLQTEDITVSTPKSRGIKLGHLTPSMGKRTSALMKPATPLQEARSRLHVSVVPKSLPCREEEFNTIFTFLKRKLMDKSGGCIYISGVPGTGKTATVNEAVRCLQKLIIKGQLDEFNYVAINGMKLTEPRQAYVQILKQLTGQVVAWEQASRALEKKFCGSSSNMTLLLVDELDFLCTKRQDVVYNLFDWPTKESAQLVVITIANTMDLPERVLMSRVTSRLGLTRLTFQPYNYKQLQEIVVTRLTDFNDFRSEAIQLVARKVSAVSGDARRALDICRRAMEITESRNAETISLQDVTQAVMEMIASTKIQAIKFCSKMEQIFLQAVAAEVTRTAVEEVYFNDAYRQLESLCCFDGIRIPSVTEVLAVCERLNASKLIICEHSRADLYQKVLLNVSPDDIHYALQELDLNSA